MGKAKDVKRRVESPRTLCHITEMVFSSLVFLFWFSCVPFPFSFLIANLHTEKERTETPTNRLLALLFLAAYLLVCFRTFGRYSAIHLS
jgi:predicted acyltransferase